MNDLEAINQIGIFSKRNINFLNNLKKNNIDFENKRKTTKNIIRINNCTITFDYNDLEIKTKGNCEPYIKYLN